MGEVVILASYRVHFIIEHENLVQDPSNNISIICIYSPFVLHKVSTELYCHCQCLQEWDAQTWQNLSNTLPPGSLSLCPFLSFQLGLDCPYCSIYLKKNIKNSLKLANYVFNFSPVNSAL